MNIMKSIGCTLMILVAVSLLPAQEFSTAGTAAAQFLKIPVGARAIAMGGSFASIGDDATTLFWNPAGASYLNRYEASFSHTTWIADMPFNFAALIVPIDESSTMGISAVMLTTGDIEQTTIEQPQGTKTFYDATDLAFGLTYARAMTPSVSIGVSVKYITQRIYNESASTVGCDLGALLKVGYKDLKFGLTLQNFGPSMKMAGRDLIRQIDQDPNSTANPYVEADLATQNWNLPASYRVSASMSVVGESGLVQLPMSKVLVSVGAVHSKDSREQWSIGGEYEFLDVLFLRAGNCFNTDEEGLTFGAGVRLNVGSTTLLVDYASSSFGVFGNLQHMTLGIMF